MECYSALRKKEILLFFTTLIDPEGTMLNKSEKDKYSMILFLGGIF